MILKWDLSICCEHTLAGASAPQCGPLSSWHAVNRQQSACSVGRAAAALWNHFDEDRGVCLQFASLKPSGALKSELEALGMEGIGLQCKERWANLNHPSMTDLGTHLKKRIQLFSKNSVWFFFDSFLVKSAGGSEASKDHPWLGISRYSYLCIAVLRSRVNGSRVTFWGQEIEV